MKNQIQRHVRVTNVEWDTKGSVPTLCFDVEWDGSWRNDTSWDAAWIFAKIRPLRAAASPEPYPQSVEETAAQIQAGTLPDLNRYLNLPDGVPFYVQSSSSSTQGASTTVSLTVEATAYDQTLPRTTKFDLTSADSGGTNIHSVMSSPRLWLHVPVDPDRDHYTPPADGRIDPAEDGRGIFLYRDKSDEPWSGTARYEGVRIPCPTLAQEYELSAEELPRCDVWVTGLEMVHVAQGAYELGDPAPGASSAPNNCFHTKNAEGELTTYSVQSEARIETNRPDHAKPGELTWNAPSPDSNWGAIPEQLPKGFKAFYCMKRQVTQGEYADFINSLGGLGQAITARYPYGGEGDYRFQIHRAASGRVALRPLRACNWLAWADGIAYAWWAGLRPMSELEYEKACRGPLEAVAQEYSWGRGGSTFRPARIIMGAEGGPYSPVTAPVSGNANLANAGTPLQGGDQGMGPVCDDAFGHGIFPPGVDIKHPSTDETLDHRQHTGTTYYGIYAMTGNLWEFTVNVCSTGGRAFDGSHGNGQLGLAGTLGQYHAGDLIGPVQTTWPAPEDSGNAFRGGSWYTGAFEGRLADRSFAGSMKGYTVRSLDTGMRCVRTAPGS